MNEDARREAFILAAVKEMRSKSFSFRSHTKRILCYLRTVWLEARNEPWGENVKVGGGVDPTVIITDEGVSDG